MLETLVTSELLRTRKVHIRMPQKRGCEIGAPIFGVLIGIDHMNVIQIPSSRNRGGGVFVKLAEIPAKLVLGVNIKVGLIAKEYHSPR